MNKLNIGIIGAGSISQKHLASYKQNPYAEVKIIYNRSIEKAQSRAAQYHVPNFCDNLDEILNDPSINAVSIVTPTYTHKDLVLQALNAGKHVLCEKPPALTAEDVEECIEAAKKAKKILMYGFVVRFRDEVEYLKQYIDAGNMGDIYYVEASRLMRCFKIGGWFVDKEKSGGGQLMDGAIHELDTALYLMGFPKVKSVSGFTTMLNTNLADQIHGIKQGYVASDNHQYERTIESLATGYVKFENGACLNIRASFVLNTLNPCRKIELCGTKAGVEYGSDGLRVLSITDNNYYSESKPILTENNNAFDRQINHYVDCCLNGTECIVQPWQGKEVIRIINAIYDSARTGKEILF